MMKFSKAEVLPNGTIQVRTQEVLELADGTTREGGYHRKVYTPDTDTATIEYPQVKAMAEAMWTPEVIADYLASIEG